MAYFALSHRVLYHDTMAQGTHHFLTNFKFQCEAREHFFFGRIADATPDGRALLDEINVVTLDGYARSLAPVEVGDTVGILLSVEDRTPSSLRFCFRIVRRDGVPVSCGFQTIVTTSRRTGAVVVGPDAIARAAAPLTERLRRPSFQQRVLAGGSATQGVFDETVVRAGVAAAKGFEPGIVPDLLLPSEPGVVLLFPGQGSWDPAFLDELQRLDPTAAPLVRRINDIAVDAIGAGFLGQNTSGSAHAADAQQVGIYASGVLSARYLIDRGVKPLLLLGHSFGEVAALAVGGAFDYEEGARLICARVASLQAVHQPPGGMLAVMCDESRAQALVDRIAPSSVEIALVNHPSQTVVSGTQADLQRLASVLRDHGISGIPLASRYPFHSSQLREAVAPFATAVRRIEVRPLHTPVYSAGDSSLHARRPALATLLPQHLVSPSIFADAVECALGLGGRTFIDCGAGRVLGGLVRKNLRGQSGVTTLTAFADEIAELPGVKAAAPVPARAIEGLEPIAIVSIGAVLPGAESPEALWQNVLAGRTGIVDLAEVDATLVADFTASERMTPDKTYTLLCGRAPDETGPIASALSDTDVHTLPTAGRFFAQAATQCLSGLKSPLPAAARIRVVVGSTADGSREFDEALVLASPAIDESVRSALEQKSGRRLDDAGMVTGPRAYTRVARALFGAGVDVAAVDAACASSLYAIDLGVDALREKRCDLAVCGGAFAPGPASTCLFAQFQGLSATGSRPLDASADGVVFGEGSALVMLKRLSDAIAAGDRVHAVIRTIAASSDGKSASVMEPKQGGQLLALRRAAERSGIAPSTLQFIDAHATATPVGDAVEFASIREAVGPPVDGQPRVRVGSLKAAIGHTGWVAGAASLVEVCKALDARTFPPQVAFTAANPRFELSSSNIEIDARPAPWPENGKGLPRRAGINGFGFGGVNAHLLLEEFDADYHGRWRRTAQPAGAPLDSIAIVASSSLLPAQSWTFSADELGLPSSLRVLPDVLDEMDGSQRLALKAAHDVLSALPDSWKTLRADTAVILGFDGKTRRGIDALVRVYVDRLKRRFADIEGDSPSPAMKTAIAESIARLERLPRTGPYTLAGAMPNVTAGRVSNVFNLNGPNFVIDAEGRSLGAALVEGARALRAGKCRFVLAGGIASSAGADVQRLVDARLGQRGRPVGEGAVMFALTRASIARELGLPIFGYLTHAGAAATANGEGAVTIVGTAAPAFLMGAEGAVELSDAIQQVRQRHQPAAVRWTGGDRDLEIRLSPDTVAHPVQRADSKPIPEALARLIAVPTQWTTPRWVEEDAPPTANGAWNGRRVLILTDRPSWCMSDDVKRVLEGMEYRVVAPAASRVDGVIGVSMATDASARESVHQLDDWPYDAVIVLTTLQETDPIDAVITPAGFEHGLLDLMFVVSRHAYARLERGEVTLGVICLNAGASADRLHPFTGLPSGFLRSLSRELPRLVCCLVNASDGDVAGAMNQLAAELERSAGRVAPPEVCRIDGRRYVQKLTALEDVGALTPPLLTSDSVVVATGGAQGVTAVLVETIRRQFGCATVMVGRTDPGAAPPDVLAMDDKTFESWEPEFYRHEMAATPGIRPAELKARFNTYRSAREASGTLRALAGTPGAVRYIRADVTDAEQVDAVITQVVAEFGRVDLVLHGAGIQTSKVLEKKPLETFRAIIATKLGGLGRLVHACRNLVPGRMPHFHLVTSTFSYAGNAGQEDYGAANQAMDRLAQYLTATGGVFEASSLGWIGWVNVGMTRGSEYTMVAIQRGLGGVTRETGGECFRQYISARPPSAIAYVITERETTYFGIPIAPSDNRAADRPQRLEQPLPLDVVTHPFLNDHRVTGAPTLPASFGLDIAARIACALRPGQYLQRFVNISVDRFVKIPDGRPFDLRRIAEVIDERDGTTRILVKLMSDFVHRSGRVLQADVVHMSSEVVLGPSPVEPAITHHPVTPIQSGWHLSDPYLHPDAPVRLGGPFRSLHDITVTPASSTATFDGPDADDVQTSSGALIPFVLLDAVFRLAALRREDDGSALLCVPLSCARIDVWAPADGNNASGRCTLRSSPARFEGDRVNVSWAEAIDEHGRVILTLRDIVGAVYGRVPAEVERIRFVRTETPPIETSPAVQIAGAPSPDPARRLDGKIALVTGSGRGIGKVIALRLAELGATIVVNSFHSRTRGEETTAEIVERGGKAVHAWGSVANPAHLTRIFEEVDTQGGLDYFVSNASTGIFAPLKSVTAEQWERSFRTNVVALHQASFMAAARMARRGGGRIVALSSIGTRWCFDYFGLVGSVKAAVEALVGYLAVELAPSHVEVTAVAAGAVDGELLRQFPDRPRWETQAPDGQMTTELQVADAVAFLLTSSGMNGTTVVLDGASGVRAHEPALVRLSEN